MNERPRYRWTVLAVAAFGAGAFAGLRMGLPALAPAIRDEYALTLSQVGVAFAALGAGVMLTLIAWGALTDRFGERPVMTAGLLGTAGAMVGAGLADSYLTFTLALLLAGAMGASATGASGRAIMGWFARRERGMALGIRQMALPLGGALGSLALPAIAAGAGGLRATFFAVAAVLALAALAGALFLREPPAEMTAVPPGLPPAIAPMRDGRLWRLGAGSGLLVSAQVGVLGFFVLYLHDERGVSVAAAAGLLAAVQLIGALGRVRAGRVSDRLERRIAPMRLRALVAGTALVLVAGATWAPNAVLIPILTAATIATMTWNSLAFTAAAEISGRAKAGTAMSMQNMIVAVGGAASPALMGVVVQHFGWTLAFFALAVGPFAAWFVLAPLVGEEDQRAAARNDRVRRSASLSVSPSPSLR